MDPGYVFLWVSALKCFTECLRNCCVWVLHRKDTRALSLFEDNSTLLRFYFGFKTLWFLKIDVQNVRFPKKWSLFCPLRFVGRNYEKCCLNSKLSDNSVQRAKGQISSFRGMAVSKTGYFQVSQGAAVLVPVCCGDRTQGHGSQEGRGIGTHSFRCFSPWLTWSGEEKGESCRDTTSLYF